jgi:hypothetical protein
MARDRANINTNIWTDQDWRELPKGAKYLYQLLLTHGSLNYAGVADWRPNRIAALSPDDTVEAVREAATALQEAHFVYADDDTEEILIRSFLRHDGLLKQPKLSISMVTACGAISSTPIRQIISFELARLFEEHPDWAAFRQDKVMSLVRAKGKNIRDFTHTESRGLPIAEADGCPSFTLKTAQADAQALGLPTTTATTTATSSKEDLLSSAIADAIPRPEVEELLDLLDTQIALNGLKKPSRTRTNFDAARLLIDRDGYDIELIKQVLLWATADEFWRKNILSMSKFRAQFTQLLAKSGLAQSNAGTARDIDPDVILGKDYWTVPEAPEGTSIADGLAWKKARRVEHEAERLELAREKVMGRAA